MLWGRERKAMPCDRREDAKGTQTSLLKAQALPRCKPEPLKANPSQGPHPRQEDTDWEPIGTESGLGRINSTPHTFLPVKVCICVDQVRR